MVDDHVQLEAVKPAGEVFAALGNAFDYPLARDTHVVADGQRRGVGNRQARAGVLERLKQSG